MAYQRVDCDECGREYPEDCDECLDCGCFDAELIDTGGGPGRFWGYRGLRPVLAIRQVRPAVGIAAGRYYAAGTTPKSSRNKSPSSASNAPPAASATGAAANANDC